jgi:hypothetical protein
MTASEIHPDSQDLATLCTDHLRHEETLLAAALPLASAVRKAFTQRGFDAFAAALGRHADFAQLVDEMTVRRLRLREELAGRLGMAPKEITLAGALANLPDTAKAAVAAGAARVRRLAEELATTNYWVSVHLRIHLDAYRCILRDLTNTSTGSGRYGREGTPELLEYRPLLQIHG